MQQPVVTGLWKDVSKALPAIPGCCMNWLRIVLLAFIFFYCAPSSQAQTSPATLPDMKVSTAGTVYAIVVQSDGKIVFGGRFTAVYSVPRHNIERINQNRSV